MADYIEVHWTSGSLDEARKISRYLVQERLVACVQIIPWIESIYQWDNQIETEQESKISMKTIPANFEKIKEIILENHSYEVPEITVHPIQDGNPQYLEWLESQVAAIQ